MSQRRALAPVPVSHNNIPPAVQPAVRESLKRSVSTVYADPAPKSTAKRVNTGLPAPVVAPVVVAPVAAASGDSDAASNGVTDVPGHTPDAINCAGEEICFEEYRMMCYERAAVAKAAAEQKAAAAAAAAKAAAAAAAATAAMVDKENVAAAAAAAAAKAASRRKSSLGAIGFSSVAGSPAVERGVSAAAPVFQSGGSGTGGSRTPKVATPKVSTPTFAPLSTVGPSPGSNTALGEVDDLFNDGKTFNLAALATREATVAVPSSDAAFSTRSLTSELGAARALSSVAPSTPGADATGSVPAVPVAATAEPTAPIQLIQRKPISSFTIFCDEDGNAPAPTGASTFSSAAPSPGGGAAAVTAAVSTAAPVLGVPTPAAVSPIARPSTSRRSAGSRLSLPTPSSSFSTSFSSVNSPASAMNSDAAAMNAAAAAAGLASEVAADHRAAMEAEEQAAAAAAAAANAAQAAADEQAAAVAAVHAAVMTDEPAGGLSSVASDSSPAPAEPGSAAVNTTAAAESGIAAPPSLSPITETSREDDAVTAAAAAGNVSTASHNVSGVSGSSFALSISSASSRASTASALSFSSVTASAHKNKSLTAERTSPVNVQLEFTAAAAAAASTAAPTPARAAASVIDRKSLSGSAAACDYYATIANDAAHRASLLVQNQIAVNQLPGVITHADETLPVDADAVAANPGIGISVDDKSYNVEGGIAHPVFSNGETRRSFLVSDLDGGDEALALTIHTPADLWDALITQRFQQKAGSVAVAVSAAYQYADASITVRRYYEKSLAAVIASYATRQLSLPADVALYYGVEIMHGLIALRKARIVHGGLTPHAFVIPNNTFPRTLGEWSAERANGWLDRALSITDFGPFSADLSLYSAATDFTRLQSAAANASTAALCTTTGSPFIAIDSLAACEILYALAFGASSGSVSVAVARRKSDKRWAISLPASAAADSKSGDAAVWNTVFDALLNEPADLVARGDVSALATARSALETALSGRGVANALRQQAAEL